MFYIWQILESVRRPGRGIFLLAQSPEILALGTGSGRKLTLIKAEKFLTPCLTPEQTPD
jgi:hypothetical protein